MTSSRTVNRPFPVALAKTAGSAAATVARSFACHSSSSATSPRSASAVVAIGRSNQSEPGSEKEPRAAPSKRRHTVYFQ